MNAQYPYQDSSLPVEQRVDDLMSRMAIEDKAGLLFLSIVFYGDLFEAAPAFAMPSLGAMVTGRRINHLAIIGGAPSAADFALWHNEAQDIAHRVGLGIPVTFASDPRHAFQDHPGTAAAATFVSQWPETVGLAALRSEELVQRFADIVRQEYTALGIRLALHPQIDVATEPRWARGGATFGEDADLTARLGAAYVRGLQGGALGESSVSAMAKHFPGGGPQQDGEDPHFTYGKEQVYPGGMFDLHLKPFQAVIDAGVSQIMPYYGQPIGTEYPELGFGFNKPVITGLLRETLGFDGIVCTDFGLLTDVQILGTDMPARAWGAEHLSRAERIALILEAGADQFGGELCTEELLGAVRSGAVAEERIDVSVRRVLTEKFKLGLFDDKRYVDVEHARITVGKDEFRALGQDAQERSLTLLTNGEVAGAPILPLAPGSALYVEGLDPAAFADWTLVGVPEQADIAIIHKAAPYEERGVGFEAFFHAGSLEFPADEQDRLVAVTRTVPTVLSVTLERPVILGELAQTAAAVIGDYGASALAIARVLTGAARPEGKLPFDLPRSTSAVEASREDVPFDTEDPAFRFGDGLQY